MNGREQLRCSPSNARADIKINDRVILRKTLPRDNGFSAVRTDKVSQFCQLHTDLSWRSHYWSEPKERYVYQVERISKF